MSVSLSMNDRKSYEGQASDELMVALIRINHPDLSEPALLSTDNTTVLSQDPLKYGTTSTWKNPVAEEYQYVLVAASLPDNDGSKSGVAGLIVENTSNDIGILFIGLNSPPTVDIGIVSASEPNIPRYEVANLQMVSVTGTRDQYTLSLSRVPYNRRPFPKYRATAARLGALWK